VQQLLRRHVLVLMVTQARQTLKPNMSLNLPLIVNDRLPVMLCGLLKIFYTNLTVTEYETVHMTSSNYYAGLPELASSSPRQWDSWDTSSSSPCLWDS